MSKKNTRSNPNQKSKTVAPIEATKVIQEPIADKKMQWQIWALLIIVFTYYINTVNNEYALA